MLNTVQGYNLEAEKELIGRARELQPLILKHAKFGDENRRLHPDVVSNLTDAGFWDMAIPRRWGGLGTSAVAMARVGAELGKADPSVAWIYTVYHGACWTTGLAPDALQEEVFGGGSKPIICSVANPPGIVEEVDGGYIVNGRWPYASGSRHASWGYFGAKEKMKDGAEVFRGFVYIPMNQCRIEDTWFFNGMKGTGSETVVAENVFVPKHCLWDVHNGIGYHEPGKRHVGEPQDYWPFMPFLRATAHGAVAGAALAILDRVAEASKRRPVLYTTYTRQADMHVVHHHIGQAAAKLSAAWTVVEKNCARIDEVGLTRVPMTPAERAMSKGEGSICVDLVSQAVDTLMFLAGSSAFSEANDLHRFYRDLLFAVRHTANLPYVGYEILGKSILGVEPNIAPPDFI